MNWIYYHICYVKISGLQKNILNKFFIDVIRLEFCMWGQFCHFKILNN